MKFWRRIFLPQIFQQKINSITVAAALVAISSLLSRILGLFRDRILASHIGPGPELDIYFAAFRIPDLLYNLVVLGALSAGFIPVFSQLIKNFNPKKSEDNAEAWSLVNNVLNALSLVLIVLGIIGVIFAPSLMKLVAPGFTPENQLQAANLTRIMFLSPLLLGISGIVGATLQSFKRFFAYSLSPIFYNLGIIVGALWLVDIWGLSGLAWGVVLGALFHLLVQLPALFNLGFRYQPLLNWRDKNLRKIGRLMVPRTLSLALGQIDLLVITSIASGLAAGSLTIFTLANNLQSFPVGIFGVSFAVAAFPTLAQYANDKKNLEASFSATFRRILFFVIPSTVLMITLRAQIVRVVFGAGVFSWEDTVLTMNALALFSLSLFAQASIPLLVRVFYARQDSKTPFFISLLATTVNVVLAVLLSRRLGVLGLPLAYSISSIFNFLLLWFYLIFKVGSFDLSRIAISALKFSLAALGAGAAIQITKQIVGNSVDMTTFVGVFTQLSLAAIAGVAIYLLICYLLRSEEFFGLLDSWRQRSKLKPARVSVSVAEAELENQQK